MLKIVFFSATWCGVCKTAKISAEIAAQELGAAFFELDMDQSRATYDKYTAGTCNSVPFVAVLNGDTVILRKCGGFSSADLVADVNLALSGFAPDGNSTDNQETGTVLPEVIVTASRVKSWFSRNWYYLLLLIAVIVAAWFGFKAIGKPRKQQTPPPSQPAPAGNTRSRNAQGRFFKP